MEELKQKNRRRSKTFLFLFENQNDGTKFSFYRSINIAQRFIFRDCPIRKRWRYEIYRKICYIFPLMPNNKTGSSFLMLLDFRQWMKLIWQNKLTRLEFEIRLKSLNSKSQKFATFCRHFILPVHFYVLSLPCNFRR